MKNDDTSTFIFWFAICALFSGVCYDNRCFGTAWGFGIVAAVLLLGSVSVYFHLNE